MTGECVYGINITGLTLEQAEALEVIAKALREGVSASVLAPQRSSAQPPQCTATTKRDGRMVYCDQPLPHELHAAEHPDAGMGQLLVWSTPANVPTESWPVNWASRAVEQGLEQCANWGTAYNSTMPVGVSNQCERPSGHLQHGVPDHATLPSNLPGYQWR